MTARDAVTVAADALAAVCRDALFGPTRDIERRVREAGFDDALDWVSDAIDRYDAARGAPVALGVNPPTDADVEALRRAMVDAHQTYRAIDGAMMCDPTWTGVHDALARARRALVDAARAHEEAVYLAKRARGGL